MIFTLYFGCKFIKELHMPLVSVSLSKPAEMTCKRFLALAPSREMIDLAHAGRTNEYSNLYTSHVLSRLDPVDTYRELDGSVLLCWEKTGKFCHRHPIASWLEEAVGIPVLELDEAAAAALNTLEALQTRRIA